MRLEEQLAREVTGDIESDNWEKLFDAKVAAGEDVSKALTRLEEKDEASAWTKYYNRTKKQTVYVCSQSGGQIYIWTRDVGTTDAPEHVTQIGYKGAALLVATEWSLTGTFSKNDVTQTTLAYKSWFTKYVKDSTGEIKNKSDQALRDALAGAGVIAKTGVLKVYYSGAPLATGANIINSFTCGVWAILACEKFVKGLVPKPYLVVDTLNFDQKSDWVKLLVEGTDDVFLGAEGGTDVIPKPGMGSSNFQLS
ncbi:hypothetical protein BV22DRAFT_1038597 [Leucogyrophana mollusca]|uniref:Uncharacterized protein n=1 Tax=Leucogyrophana mollusca TaxID=85980 RepID=A0ACB8B786_9AGAM|nr:hypothetical protein BV22DRAFT_1038597 [Leucogyrophana mollusca]